MSKIVFVAGLKESGYGTVIDMVLEGSRNKLGRHLRLGFEERELKKMRLMLPEDTKKSVAGLYKDIEKQASAGLKSGSNVIIEGPLTLKTEDGYLPLIPKRFFESFRPDVFILFESQERSTGIDMLQQEINRSYAAMYASLAGSLLRVISIKKGGVKDALRSTARLMENFVQK
jgi:adenylate kinase